VNFPKNFKVLISDLLQLLLPYDPFTWIDWAYKDSQEFHSSYKRPATIAVALRSIHMNWLILQGLTRIPQLIYLLITISRFLQESCENYPLFTNCLQQIHLIYIYSTEIWGHACHSKFLRVSDKQLTFLAAIYNRWQGIYTFISLPHLWRITYTHLPRSTIIPSAFDCPHELT
jgi:hypothetical protein